MPRPSRALLLACALGLVQPAPEASARDLARLFEGASSYEGIPSARQMVDDAYKNLFAPETIMWIETLRTDAEGNGERARYRVLRRAFEGSLRVMTESLGPPASIAGTRVLQVESLDALEMTYAYARSVSREPFETTFRLADPFLCTWYEKEIALPETFSNGIRPSNEILGRRRDEIAGEPVQRILMRPVISRGYDRIELAIAERDNAILEYLYFLNVGDRSPSLIARANREDMIEFDDRVLPRILRYDDRLMDQVVFVTILHGKLPSEVSDTLFEPRSFHRARTDDLAEPAEQPAP